MRLPRAWGEARWRKRTWSLLCDGGGGCTGDRDAAAQQTQDAERQYYSAIKNAYRVLSDSDVPRIQHLMAGEWSDHNTFMQQVHPAHAVWQMDEQTQMARNALAHTRAALMAAQARQREGEQAAANRTSSAINTLVNVPSDGWMRDAQQIAADFGEVISTASTQCFIWARSALKAATRLL